MKFNQTQHGVTLIELMIVVAIIAIVGAFAFNSYREYGLRAARSEAKSALLAVAAAQEKEYLKNNSYTSVVAELDFVDADGLTETGRYKITIVTEDGGFVATAMIVDGADAACDKMVLNHLGQRSSEPAANQELCWQ